MTASKYQKWVPREAIQCYEAEVRHSTKAQPENALDSRKRFEALLTSDDLNVRELWNLVNEKPVAEGAKALQSWYFPSLACRWIMGPMGDESHTRKDREKWICDVTKAAQQVSALVKGTTLDNYFAMYLPEYQDGYRHDRISVTLETFAARVEKITPQATKKPKDDKARRAYFVRQLTAYLEHHFKKRHREIVVAVTNIVFADGDISERQVQSLAKVEVRKKRESI